MDEQEKQTTPPVVQRGLGHDLLIGAAGAGVQNVVGPVVQQVTEHVLNRPSKEQPPQVVLPPGVPKDE